ncbi:hypothetical protein [Micrococcus sp.]|uniref:hypothetical protein n=1 Tax=Micrococcus sp. TaxID=1271 RepID=UPI002A9183DE|nr:hypothetical protein [Micrococcus sp.]MDY6055264.1 hypothetical protein [Micrococcus sp.]
MIQELTRSMHGFVEGLPEALQGLGVFLVGLVPLVEGEGAAMIGVIAGVSPWVAAPAAVLGNLLAVGLLVYAAHGTRSALARRRAAGEGSTASGTAPASVADDTADPRRARLRRRFESWGVPGVSLVGPWLLIPGHLAAPAMVSFGASRNRVMAWQAVAIVLYSGLAAVLAALLMHAVGVQATAETFGL